MFFYYYYFLECFVSIIKASLIYLHILNSKLFFSKELAQNMYNEYRYIYYNTHENDIQIQ